jgi:hypothetical protein
MTSFWQYFSAVAKKQLVASTPAKPLVFTKTPIQDLTQRSFVELDGVPFILSNAAGSLFRDISGNHSIIGVSKLNYIEHDFYRAYLSNDAGSFIHLGVHPSKPNDILECRIYQPYNEIIPLWGNREEQVVTLNTHSWWRSGDIDYPVTVLPDEYVREGVEYQYITYNDADGKTWNIGVPKDQIVYTTDEVDESLNWEFWLLDNPDPNIGGMIGCPIMQGKNEDVDADGNTYQYSRTWVASNQRIDPVVTTELMIDVNGETTFFKHTMMHYSRPLNNDDIEYLLVSCVETDGLAYVSMWLGLDIVRTEMKISL